MKLEVVGQIIRRSKRPDLRCGDWIEIDARKGTGVGKLTSIIAVPDGWVACILSFRAYDEPRHRETVFCDIENGRCALLEKAVKMSGPLKANGKRPTPVTEAS